MDLEKLMTLASSLGLTKEEMLDLYERENQRRREERAAVRDANREEEERAKRMADVEKEKLAQEKELVELKLRLANASASNQSGEQSPASPVPQMSKSPEICPRKLMAPFDDKRDDLDAYLHRFERVALGQGWEKSQWATALSLCLVGEALSVFGRMPASESMDYDTVKTALLQRFRLTADGFREKFRSAKPEDAETGKQFASRLLSYFDRWLEMSNTEKTYEKLRERMVTEQFLACCNSKLAVFLKERSLKTLEEMTTAADQYCEAQRLKNLGKVKEEGMAASIESPESMTQRFAPRAPSRCFFAIA